ncbi:MAG: carboxypeptidase regulatory-like domain-containing protein [Salinibacter sp.]
MITTLLLILAVGPVPVRGQETSQNAVLRGFVRSEAGGKPLGGANVVLRQPGGRIESAVATNDEGFYQLAKIPPGRYRLQITFIGFQAYRDTLRLEAGARRTVSVELASATRRMKEVTVEGGRTVGEAQSGLREIRTADIKNVPTPGPGSDLASYLRTLPEVTTTGDRGGRLYIRGGTPSQNLVLVDGTPIYKPFHIIGFYSAFPGSIVSSANFHAGGFGAKYTSRISSVMDVQIRPGNTKELQGSVGVGPFLASAHLEGPLQKGSKSFLVHARHSLIERSGPTLLGQDAPYEFYDVTAKLHTQGAQNQCSFTGVRTYDRGRIDPENRASFRWSNTSVGGECLVFSDESAQTLHVSFGTTHFNNEVRSTDGSVRAAGTWKVRTKFDLTQPAPWRGTLRWGGKVQADDYDFQLRQPFLGFESDDRFLLSASVYAGAEWKVTDGLTIQPSIGGQSLFEWGGVSVDPRVRVSYQPGGDRPMTLTAAVGVYHQIPTTVTDERDVGSTFQVWTPSPFRKRPLRADHALLGWNQRLLSDLRISIEGWYKRFQDLPVPRWTPLVQFNTNLVRADGTGYGVDLSVQYERGPVRVDLTYGYGRVRYRASKNRLGAWVGDPIIEYSPPHDRRHKLGIVTSLDADWITANLRWQYGSGLPFTQVYGYDTMLEIRGLRDDPENVVGLPRALYERPYRSRLPDYHRLDVSLSRSSDVAPNVRLSAEAGAINAYNRANVFYIDLFTLDRVDQLPLIPYLTLQVNVQ